MGLDLVLESKQSFENFVVVVVDHFRLVELMHPIGSS